MVLNTTRYFKNMTLFLNMTLFFQIIPQFFLLYPMEAIQKNVFLLDIVQKGGGGFNRNAKVLR